MSHRIGDDPSGQTIYDGERMVAVGCTAQAAAALVDRLNSAPARQEDVDLLQWLLAEKTHEFRVFVDMVNALRGSAEKAYDRAIAERDSARAALDFWGVVERGTP